ncbi:sodium:calcium antiporter [Candidatus Poriferisocius sp.]|uniref:sodium:calcium antiporter n=1 Tax=Candidatus Poriferisocius sp. TaxID=3101276 RepID=UPI003B58EA30
MALAAVLLAGGLIVLAVGADQLVVGASRLAFARGISPIVIGALVIGFGTSAPEMLVSGLAAADGDADLGVGNIIGSNVANLSLVLGSAALVAALAAGGRYIRVAHSTLQREGAISVAAAVLFWLLVQDGFERWEGIVLLVAFLVAMAVILWRPPQEARAAEVVPADKPISQPAELARTVLGLAATVVGAQMAVEGAVDIALEVGLGSGFVGLSLVAFGTSLPELITGVQAARRGEADLLVGNILGSNTFNSLLVSAVVAFAGPGPLVDANLSGLAVWIMMGISVGAWLLMFRGDGIERWWEGAMLLAVYLVSLPFLISDPEEQAVPTAPAVEVSQTVGEPGPRA